MEVLPKLQGRFQISILDVPDCPEYSDAWLARPQAKYSRLSDHDLDIRADPEVYPEEDQKIRQLYTHISKLKDLDKTIVFLYLEECSYVEIAEITGISVKNVSVRLVRIRERLRKLFKVKNSAT